MGTLSELRIFDSLQKSPVRKRIHLSVNREAESDRQREFDGIVGCVIC